MPSINILLYPCLMLCFSRFCKCLLNESTYWLCAKKSVQVKVLVAYLCLTFATPQSVAHQAPLSMEFSRWEYLSGLPFSSPGDLPDLGIKFRSPALEADSLVSEPPGKSKKSIETAMVVTGDSAVCWDAGHSISVGSTLAFPYHDHTWTLTDISGVHTYTFWYLTKRMGIRAYIYFV